MEFVQNKYAIDVNRIFNGGDYLDAKALFWALNGVIPTMHSIYPIDVDKALKFFEANYKDEIDTLLKSSNLNDNNNMNGFELDEVNIVLKDKSVLKITYNYCDILTRGDKQEWIESLSSKLKKFRRREKKKEFELNLISVIGNNFSLKSIDVKKTRLNLDLYYEDEFLETDKIIRERLNRNKDKGIVLLHGLPGTGKTTYLRYLIGKVKKRVMFVPPSVAGNITNPEFMNLLLEYPNSILIIEDAENIIMDRQITGSSAVSNLLNISDGLLGDCLNTQIICTFNMPISKIDTALTRKGRLIAKYHFGKLSVAKAQQLSDKMKLGVFVTEPMSLAELFNTHEKDSEDNSFRVLGFKREQVLN